jgi:hypothetical protein
MQNGSRVAGGAHLLQQQVHLAEAVPHAFRVYFEHVS